MRGLLVVNPAATTTTERVRDVLVTALSADLAVETVITKGRGHAAELAQRATETGIDVVITLGGDGTVNEVANGLLRDGPNPNAPALAVVPGGSTNVFARALGFSASPVEATGELLAHLREGRSRRVGLGHARWADQSRWFTFCAGMGLDAAVVRRVEQARLRGRVSSPALYLNAFVGQIMTGDRRDPPLSLELTDEVAESALSMVVVQNTAPWTYIGDRAVDPNPEASFERGLDVLAVRRLTVPATTRTVTQLLTRGTAHGRQVLRLHDRTEFTVRAGRPQAFQVDGDYLGEREKVHFLSVPDALRVIC
jgi:diacylglycerol kinase family enzyme